MLSLRFFILIFLAAIYLQSLAQPLSLEEQPIDSALTWMQNNYNQDSIDIHEFGLRVLDRTDEATDPRLMGDLHKAIADWIGYTGMVRDSLLVHDYKALFYYEKLGDVKLIAGTYSTLSIDLLNAQQLEASQEATFKSIELFESIDDKGGIANAHRSLAYLHIEMEDPLVSVEYGKKAYDYYKSVDDYNRMSYTLLSQVQAYKEAGLFEEARAAGEECLNIVYEKVPDEVFVLGRAYSYLGDLSIKEDKLEQALKETRKAFSIVSKEIGEERASDYNHGIANVLRLQDKWREALDIYEVILVQMEKQGIEGVAVIHKQMYQCYKNLGNNSRALIAHEKYTEIINATKEETIANLKSEAVIKYETAEKDQELAVQQAVIKQKSRLQNASYGVGAVLISLLGSLFYFFQQNKKVTTKLKIKNGENKLLVKEIHHRVKNNLQILSSLLSLQSDAEENEEVLGALQEGRNRVESMGMIHQRLYSQDTFGAIDMKEYIPDLCEYLKDMSAQKSNVIGIKSDIEVGMADIETAIPLGLIVNELITNSIKYAQVSASSATIRVRLWKDDNDLLCLQVGDDGAVLSDTNMNSKSTKFGTKLIGILSKKMKGTIDVNREDGYETTIRFSRYKLV